MIPIQINNYNYLVNSSLSIIEACKFVGIVLPRFCYDEKLSVAASCRMCVVEIEKLPKPVTACSADILSNIVVFTDTPFLQKARENVLEALLLNHPLDCPICDQGGECDLQDQVKVFGSFYSRFYTSNKLTVEDKFCGPLIKTIMTRCIMCTRCVRFGSEIAGIDLLGTLNRGGASEIGGYVSKLFDSEISGNVIDLCPVGALTSNTYSFKVRPWELRTLDSIDLLDSLGSNIYLNFKESKLLRVLPKVNEDLNENWISDKTRFSYDALSSKNCFQNTHSFFDNSFSSSSDFLKTDVNTNSILVNEDTDLELLYLLKNLTRLSKNIKVCSVVNFSKKENFSVSFHFDKIKYFNRQIKTCFIFTSNVRIENALLNTKLRVKFLHKNFNTLGFGLPIKSNFPIKCLNLNFKSLILFLEGKYPVFSKFFFVKTPLFLIGGGFGKRWGTNSFVMSNFIKSFFPTSLVYSLEGSSNTSTCRYLDLKPLNKNVFLKSNSFTLYNLNYNFGIKNLFDCGSITNSKKFGFVLTPFKSFINNMGLSLLEKNLSLVVVPALNPIEFEGIYTNLEDRPQKTQSLQNFSKTFKDFLITFFLTKKGFIAQNLVLTTIKKKEFLSFISIKDFNSNVQLAYIFELINKYTLFDTIKVSFVINLNKDFKKVYSNHLRLSKYPFKSSIEDFYTTNLFLKQSPTMLECSRYSRKLFDNF